MPQEVLDVLVGDNAESHLVEGRVLQGVSDPRLGQDAINCLQQVWRLLGLLRAASERFTNQMAGRQFLPFLYKGYEGPTP